MHAKCMHPLGAFQLRSHASLAFMQLVLLEQAPEGLCHVHVSRVCTAQKKVTTFQEDVIKEQRWNGN